MKDDHEDCAGCGECVDTEDEDALKAFESRAYKAFLNFDGVVHDEESGSVTLPPPAQARIVLNIQDMRRAYGIALNVLGALKFTVKTSVDPLPDEVKKALVLADVLIEDPEGVEMVGVDTSMYDQEIGDMN